MDSEAVLLRCNACPRLQIGNHSFRVPSSYDSIPPVVSRALVAYMDGDAEEPWRQARLHLSRRYMLRWMREQDEATVTRDHEAHGHEDGGGFCGVPASKKAMVALHMPAVGDTREENCALCLEDFKEGDKLRMMPCSHIFHQPCIFDWLLINRLCRICRFVMPSADEQRLLDEQAACGQARNENNPPSLV
uniref:RING-type domain-containing protein n=1 Tax=Arundo donax TaxID=35708 RepID=A0A0A8ZD86_ARUDO